MPKTEGQQVGSLTLISGPMIAASGMLGVAMGEIVRVGKMGLMGEVIRIDGDTIFAQVFEDTQGMYLGEPVTPTGTLLSVELGPGLLSSIFDGIQRPLPILREQSGDFIDRGLTASALNRDKKWALRPKSRKARRSKAATSWRRARNQDVRTSRPRTAEHQGRD